MMLANKRMTKVLIRLRGCAGWSAALLFANPEDSFSRVGAHFETAYQKVRHAPSKDFDQPGHPPSLLRVFAIGLKRIWTLTTHLMQSATPLITLLICNNLLSEGKYKLVRFFLLLTL